VGKKRFCADCGKLLTVEELKKCVKQHHLIIWDADDSFHDMEEVKKMDWDEDYETEEEEVEDIDDDIE